MTYRIRTVSEMTGIPRNTLIAWERRYGFVRPARHENGYRSYTDEDIERLRRVQNAIKAGLKVSEAMALLSSGESDGLREVEALRRGGADVEGTLDAVWEELTDALVNYRRERVDEILNRLAPVPFSTRLHEVFFPVLRRVGDLWESGAISVTQEHYASALLRTHFAGILLGLGMRDSRAPHAACTTFVGELHELAALALAIHLSLQGYRVSYLGPNLPPEDVAQFCASQQVQLLCVSVINSVSKDEVDAYIAALSESADVKKTRVVLGGSPLENLQLAVPAGVEVVPLWHDLRT